MLPFLDYMHKYLHKDLQKMSSVLIKTLNNLRNITDCTKHSRWWFPYKTTWQFLLHDILMFIIYYLVTFPYSLWLLHKFILQKRVVNVNNIMLFSWFCYVVNFEFTRWVSNTKFTSHADYEDNDHCKKKIHNAGYVFFLKCCHLHIPDESPKKAF